MEEDELTEAFLGIIGFSLFFTAGSIGTMLAGLDPDTGFYVEYTPSIDFMILMGILFINMIFLCIFLSKSSKFGKSRNLNRRQTELLLLTDSMMFINFLYLPIQAFLLYFFIKYFETALTMSLMFQLIFQTTIITLIFYNSYRVKKDYREDLADR